MLRISYYGVAVGFFRIAYGGMWALSLEIEAGATKSQNKGILQFGGQRDTPDHFARLQAMADSDASKGADLN